MKSRTLMSLFALGLVVMMSSVGLMNLAGCVKQEESGAQSESPANQTQNVDSSSGQANRTLENTSDSKPEAPDPIASLPQAKAGLPIVIEPRSIDLGIVSPGTISTGSVQVKNVGTDPLTILTSKTTCQCTVVDLAQTTIDPGESIEVPAQFDPGTQFGGRTATIFLIFKGYDEPVEIPIRAEVAYAVRTVPSIVTRKIPFTERFTDKPTFVVEAIDGMPFHILSVQDEAPNFLDFDPTNDETRSSYTLVFDFTKYDSQLCIDSDGRPMPSYLAIETDHPACPILDVRIRHDCTAHERAEPGQTWTLAYRRAMLGVMEPGTSVEYEVPLRWAPNAEVSDIIQSVVSESPQFSSELLDAFEKDGTFWYRVRITPAGHHRGFLYGTVRFKSSQFDMAMTIIGRVVDLEID